MKNGIPNIFDLLTIKWPIAAVVSVLHRISGVLLFIFVPFLLWLLEQSLTPDGFHNIQIYLANPFSKFVLWVFLSALGYHLFAGIRHLFMDVAFCEAGYRAKVCVWATIGSWFIFIVSIGVWILW